MPKVSFALLFLMLVAFAQQPPAKPPSGTPQNPATPASGPAKFQASAQLVIETVMVKDKSGKIIEGLTAKDFVVTEDNLPQTISICDFEKLTDAPLPPTSDTPTIPEAAEPEKPKVDPVVAAQIAPEAPGDIHHVERALHVDLAVAAGVGHGGDDAGLRGEVEDRARGLLLDRGVQRRAVGDVERVQLRSLRHVLRAPRGEVVDDAHLVAVGQQGIH